jgi:hypothetical protein
VNPAGTSGYEASMELEVFEGFNNESGLKNQQAIGV